MIGTIKELWRFPVKSMQGERLQTAEITSYGVPGDRAWGLLDVKTGKIVSAKNVKLFPDLMLCRATLVESSRRSAQAPQVRIELPGGDSTGSNDDDVDRVLSAHFQRDVRLVRAASGVRTANEYRADAKSSDDVAPAARPVIAGAFKDAWPTSVVTTATLDQLNALQPGSSFDSRRFRMNMTIQTEQRGFIENDWLDQEFVLGDRTRLRVAARDSRCIMTTLPQDGLERDTDILRTITRHNKVHVAGFGDRPCAGVYATVVEPGNVRVGDGFVLA